MYSAYLQNAQTIDEQGNTVVECSPTIFFRQEVNLLFYRYFAQNLYYRQEKAISEDINRTIWQFFTFIDKKRTESRIPVNALSTWHYEFPQDKLGLLDLIFADFQKIFLYRKPGTIPKEPIPKIQKPPPYSSFVRKHYL